MDNMEEQLTPKTNNNYSLFLKLLASGLVGLICLAAMSAFTLASLTQLDITFTRPPAITPFPTPLPYDRIAYVGNDDNIWLIAPNGSDKRQVTLDGQDYRLPTWSPNDEHLAFFGRATGDALLYSVALREMRQQIIYHQPQATPFYSYWAPDSQALSFLTQEPENQMALHYVPLRTPNEARLLVEGTPLYWVWSPDAKQLLMHVGGDSKRAHVSLLNPAPEAQREALDIAPGRFQSPLWSPDGRYIYYVMADGQRRGILYRMNMATQEPLNIASLKGPAELVLSPNGAHVAYVQLERNDVEPHGSAYVMDNDGKNIQQLADNPVSAIYWSPDSTKLALLTLGRPPAKGELASKVLGRAMQLQPPEDPVSRWLVYNLQTGETTVLKTFDPTDDFAETVPFFDQYHLSLSFWSPDSRYFLVMEQDEADSSLGTIWLTDSTGETPPQPLAEGTMAVWSWR